MNRRIREPSPQPAARGPSPVTSMILLLVYQSLLVPLGLLYLISRFVRGRPTPGIRERLAWYAAGVREALSGPGCPIWIHLVSVGEVRSAGPLIQALRQEAPQKRWIVTTTTPTGREVAGQLVRAGCDQLLYLPWDLVEVVERALDQIRPSIFLVFETELWPVLFDTLKRRGVPIVLLNARVSPRAFRRYLWIRPLMCRVLAQVDLFFTQSPPDARRYAALGAAKDRILSLGNLKWDLDTSGVGDGGCETDLRALFKPDDASLLWTAGSTHPGEERMVLEVYKRLKRQHPTLRLLIAPRHPERVAEVEQEVMRVGLTPVRRTQLEKLEARSSPPEAGPPLAEKLEAQSARDAIILLDTLGELTDVYRFSDIVFVGGSLVPHGGHNLVEPAAFARPILTGHHLHNFQAISESLQAAGGLAVVRSAEELEERCGKLLENAALRHALGERAMRAIQGHRGATQRTVEILTRRYGQLLSRE